MATTYTYTMSGSVEILESVTLSDGSPAEKYITSIGYDAIATDDAGNIASHPGRVELTPPDQKTAGEYVDFGELTEVPAFITKAIEADLQSDDIRGVLDLQLQAIAATPAVASAPWNDQPTGPTPGAE